MVTASYSTKPLSFGMDIFFGGRNANIKGKIYFRATRVVLGTLQTKPSEKEGTEGPVLRPSTCLWDGFLPQQSLGQISGSPLAPTQANPHGCHCQQRVLLVPRLGI